MAEETFADTPEVPWGALTGELAPARRKVSWGAVPPADTAPAPAPAAAPAAAQRRRGPAAPAATAGDGHTAPAAGLGDLFADDEPVAGPAAAPPADDLGGVFDEAPASAFGGVFVEPVTPAPAPAAAGLDGVFDEPEPAAAGLGGVFDEPAPGETTPVPAAVPAAALDSVFDAAAAPQPTPAAAAVPAVDLDSVFDEPAAQDPAVEPGGLDGVFAEPTDVAPAVAPAEEATASPAPGAPVGEPAEAFGATVDAPAGGPGTDAAPARLDLAARRAALAAAHVAADPHDVHDADADAARFAQLEYLYQWVDQILNQGRGGDPRLQSLVRKLELTRDPDKDAQQRYEYEAFMVPRLATAGIQIPTEADRKAVFDLAYDELIGIGPLGSLWRDDDVTEIKVMAWNRVVVERNGKLEPTAVRFRDQEHAERVARELAAKIDDRALSPTNPLVTAQLPGARVQFVWRPLVRSKMSITIRKFRPMLDMDTLLRYGSIDERMASFLCDAVAARATILVSGGTGSGKTTFVNALSEFIPNSEMVITIEDALELQLRNTYVESLLTKEAASADDRVLFGQDELLRATLRMRPDRVIVGEIRDGRGASVMLQAANTGHDGTMTTIHANTPESALVRMANLLRKVEPMPVDVARDEVTSAINVVVQVVRKRERRYVSAVSVVHPEAVHTGEPMTEPIFVGDFPLGAQEPGFRQVAALRPDTELAIKMSDAGLDPAVWELT